VTRLQADRLIGQEIGVELPDEAGDFSLLQSIQRISGAHPASYWVWRFFYQGQNGRGVKLTAHLC